MRVVLDTNIMVSALLSPFSPAARIMTHWKKGTFVVVTSSEQITEVREVSRYPKLAAIVPKHKFGEMINRLWAAEVIDDLPFVDEVLDPEDTFLITLTVGGEANWLVTGDKRSGLLQRGIIGRAKVVTAREFCDYLEK